MRTRIVAAAVAAPLGFGLLFSPAAQADESCTPTETPVTVTVQGNPYPKQMTGKWIEWRKSGTYPYESLGTTYYDAQGKIVSGPQITSGMVLRSGTWTYTGTAYEEVETNNVALIRAEIERLKAELPRFIGNPPQTERIQGRIDVLQAALDQVT